MSSSSLSNIGLYKKLFTKNSLNNLQSSSIHYIDPLKINKNSNQISVSAIKGFQISNSSFSSKANKSIILHVKILAKKKMTKKYNCTKAKYDSYIINNILRNENCHIVTLFKDILLNYSNLEFFTKFYKINKIKRLLREIYIFYKNYFSFYCKPIFNQISFNILLRNYFENKAKYFLNIENSKATENKSENNSDSINNNTIETLNQSQHIFNHYVKEFLENMSDLSNVNSIDKENSQEGTINLNMDNEKLEIFKENKRDYSNNSTFVDIIKYINIKSTKNSLNRKNKLSLKKSILISDKIRKNDRNKNFNINIEFNNKKSNKNKIPIDKVNLLLKKIKLKNFGLKLNKNLFHISNNNNDKKILLNNIHINNNTITDENNKDKVLGIKGGFLNSKKKFVNNSNSNLNLNNDYKFNKNDYLKINKRNNLNYVNDCKNKEKKEINNNISNNKNNQKSKSINKSIKENKVINQKESFKVKKKLSRNKKLAKETNQNCSFSNQNNNQKSEYKSNIKNKKKGVGGTYIKRKSYNKNKKISRNNTKTIIPIIKNNLYRHKTKFIKNSLEKIFNNLYPKIKREIPNKSNFNTIHTNKSHNCNKSNLFKTIIIDSVMSTINNDNNNSVTHTKANTLLNNNVNIKNLKFSIHNKNRSYKLKSLKLNVKKIRTKPINKNIRLNYNNNFLYLNSANTTLNNKSIFLNNYSTNASNNFRNKNSFKLLTKSKNMKDYNTVYMHNKIKNIKSLFIKNPIRPIKKPNLITNEQKYQTIKKINSFNSPELQNIFNSKEKINLTNNNINIYYNYRINRNTTNKNNQIIKDKENKVRIKKIIGKNNKNSNIANTIIINNSKIYIENGNLIIKDKDNIKTTNPIHNKSQSTYEMNLENKKRMINKI